MKQLFVLALVAVVHSSVYAQTRKGQSITSGSIGLSYSSLKGTTGTVNQLETNTPGYGVSVVLNRGTFFRDNWSINYSLSPSYSRVNSSTRSVNNSVDSKFTIENYQAGAGLALRRYWPVIEHVYVYVGGGIRGQVGLNRSISGGQSGSSTYTSETRQTQWTLQPTGQAGVLYALTNRLALEANAQTTGFPINVGSVGFGLALLTGNTTAATYPAKESITAPQLQKGRWLIGASALIEGSKQRQQLSTQPVQESNSSTATAGLLAGVFVRDNLLLGAEASYAAYRTGDETNPGTPTSGVALDVYLRSYLGSNRLRPFVQGGVNYGVPNVTAADDRLKQLGLKASAGLAYLAGDRFIIQSTLGTISGTYLWSRNEVTNTSVTSLGVAIDATLTPGFTIYYAL